MRLKTSIFLLAALSIGAAGQTSTAKKPAKSTPAPQAPGPGKPMPPPPGDKSNQQPPAEPQKTARELAVTAIAEEEREFAKMSVFKGVRESFMQYFAEKSVSFEPGPVDAQESLKKRPAGQTPFTLNWRPEFSDASYAGDMGFNTGRFTVVPRQKNLPTNYGYFFSIWQKQADGKYKVALDMGINTPEPQDKDWPEWSSAPAPRYQHSDEKVDVAAERASLLNFDRDFSKLASQKGLVLAYQQTLDPTQIRLHRNDKFAIIGRDKVIEYLAQNPATMVWDPKGGDVSKSGDLGYTYGTCESSLGGQLKHCVFTHVFEKNEKGEWKLVFDVTSVVP